MTKKEILFRLRSKVFWLGVISFILPILGHIGFYEKAGITADEFKYLIDIIFGMLVSFGLLDNPGDRIKLKKKN